MNEAKPTDLELQLAKVTLTNSTLEAVVDLDLFDKVKDRKWYLVKNRNSNYAATCMNNTSVYMHHFLFGSGMFDHKNGNGLDNTRNNIRQCNHSLNAANIKKRKGTTSCFKGVCWNKKSEKWQAQIMVSKRNKRLGMFDDERDAALAYNLAAKLAFGDFAIMNTFDDSD